MINLLPQFKNQMGYRVVDLPTKMELVKVQMYNVGVLKELVEELIALPTGKAIEVNHESLSQSNIATLGQTCKMLKYKLHCLRSGDKRILYAEKRI